MSIRSNILLGYEVYSAKTHVSIIFEKDVISKGTFVIKVLGKVNAAQKVDLKKECAHTSSRERIKLDDAQKCVVATEEKYRCVLKYVSTV